MIVCYLVCSWLLCFKTYLQLCTIGAVAYGSAYFGQGVGSVWLDNVACNGYESSLVTCSHPGIGNENCGHHEDAGVRCKGITMFSNIRKYNRFFKIQCL